VLNPFYAAYLTGLKSGAYRMRDVVPDGFFDEATPSNPQVRRTAEEEIGYVAEGWPEGCEELCIALTLTDGECAEISLLQQKTWLLKNPYKSTTYMGKTAPCNKPCNEPFCCIK